MTLKTERTESFEVELTSLINKYSMEDESNTPDFLLAEYLVNCLDAFNKVTISRCGWYGCKHKDGPVTHHAG